MPDEDEAGREPLAEAEHEMDRSTLEGPPRPVQGGTAPDSRSERLAVIDYIAELTVEFGRLAQQRNLKTLAGLLDMTHRQARADAGIARSAAPRVEGPPG